MLGGALLAAKAALMRHEPAGEQSDERPTGNGFGDEPTHVNLFKVLILGVLAQHFSYRDYST